MRNLITILLLALLISSTPIFAHNGDVDCDGRISIGDCVYLINAIFGGGPWPKDCYGDLLLLWTAVPDYDNDSTLTAVAGYVIKSDTLTITDSTWSQAALIDTVYSDLPFGSPEGYIVRNVDFGVKKYYAVKAFDQVGNLSTISNVVAKIIEEQ